MTLSSSWRSMLDPERVLQVRTIHWQEEEAQEREEQVTVEEPLEVRIGSESLAVIMRTPGHDEELALGFLLSEGVIQAQEDVVAVNRAVDPDGLPLLNVIDVTLRHEQRYEAQSAHFQRHFAVSSSCGLCGKNSIADLLLTVDPLPHDDLQLSATTFYTLAAQLRTQQTVFNYTGGLHAAGLFNTDGKLLLLREDIGRHNAVDKLVGSGLLHKYYPYQEHILLVSGRTSYEIIQKALLARIPYVVAISAPSSLAIELAERGGITLIGFLRGRAMNVYTHPGRVIL